MKTLNLIQFHFYLITEALCRAIFHQ